MPGCGMKQAASPALVPLYAGSVNTWECDEMGHMNVRFYVARAQEGLGLLALKLGMVDAFSRQARATLVPLDQHIRFLKEVRPGQPLRMVGAVTAMDQHEAWIFQELRHGDGTPAATFHTKVAHVEGATLRPFAWSQRTLEAANAMLMPLPAHGRPRSIVMDVVPTPNPTLAAAQSYGAHAIGAGIVTADQTDAFGRMRPELFIGRISDAVPNLLAGWREAVAAAASAEDGRRRTAGAAVLEYRLRYREWPRVGAAIAVHSGVLALEGKAHRLAHWLLDPATGTAWGTSEAVAITFDLETRKAIQPGPAEQKALEALMAPGMSV